MIGSQWPYIISAWGATGIGIGGYVAWILTRGRELSRNVSEDQRRWM